MPAVAAKSAPTSRKSKANVPADPPKTPRRRARAAEQKAAAAAAKGAVAPPPDAAEVGELRQIPVGLLDRSPHQRRPDPTPAELTGLRESIARSGVLQPLLARPSDREVGRYLLVAGHRRRAAAELEGLATVPVWVRDMDDLDAALGTWSENHKRNDLDPIAEAEQLDVLREEYKQAHGRFPKNPELAELAGLGSREDASNTLRLLKLPEDAKALCREGIVSKTLARTLLKWADPPGLMPAVAAWIREQGAPTVAAVDDTVGRVAGAQAERVIGWPSPSNGFLDDDTLTAEEKEALTAAGAFKSPGWHGWVAFPEADGDAISATVGAAIARRKAEAEADQTTNSAPAASPASSRAAIASAPKHVDFSPGEEEMRDYRRSWRLRQVAAGLRASEGGDRVARTHALLMFSIIVHQDVSLPDALGRALGLDPHFGGTTAETSAALAAAYRVVAEGGSGFIDAVNEAVAQTLEQEGRNAWSYVDDAVAEELADRYCIVFGKSWRPEAQYAAMYGGEPLKALCRELGVADDGDDSELRDRLCGAAFGDDFTPPMSLLAAAAAE